MVKIIFMFSLLISLVACGGKDNKQSGDTTTSVSGEPAGDISKHPDYQKGLDLIGQSDCLTCHKVDEGLNGPSYREVANKYASAGDTVISYLAGKVISGGKGNWGEVYMTPHSGLSQSDAEAMVKYILLLKK